MRHGLTVLLAILLLSAVAACGPVPKPFQAAPGEKDANTLLVIPDGAGITVAPVLGAEPALSGPLTEALVAELQRLDIPASAGAKLTNGLLMEGVAQWRNGTARIDWTLTDAKGEEPASFATTLPVAQGEYLTGAEAVIGKLARLSAEQASAALHPVATGPSESSSPQTVAVVGVDGAPGDGNRALTRAMKAVLSEAGVNMAPDEASAGLLLAGSVTLQPIDATSERVTINWWLMDATGTVLGTLDQQNTIPAGSLSDRWGGAAYDAALANVDAIRDILANIDSLREQQRHQPLQAGG